LRDITTNPVGETTASEIVALREKWHTKDHPFFVEFSEGKVGLPELGALIAQHYHHFVHALPAHGLAIYKSTGAARRFLIENLAEEEGLLAGESDGRHAVSHQQIIIRFCEAAGISRDDLINTEVLPTWRARSNFYVNTMRD